MVLRVRATLIGQRTQLINALRGHATEFGTIAAQGTGKLAALPAAIEPETAIPLLAKEMPALFGQRIDHLDAGSGRSKRG